MKHRIHKLLFAIVALLTAFAAASEAAVVSPPRERPAERTPSAPAKGPTDNITKVMNALSMQKKSLTIQVTAKPGLQLTRPVEISISFLSPAGSTTSNRVTQYYYAATGNRLVYHDGEGDGQPRDVNITITLTEPKVNGGAYTFSFFWRANVQPLYDVTISPLEFTLINNCDPVGESEIHFWWYSPDHHVQAPPSFSTTPGQHRTIQQFQWARAEVSASANLHRPLIHFWEHDASQYVSGTPLFPHTEALVPPAPSLPRTSQGNLPFPYNQYIVERIERNVRENDRQCDAQTRYIITYWLRRYESL